MHGAHVHVIYIGPIGTVCVVAQPAGSSKALFVALNESAAGNLASSCSS